MRTDVYQRITDQMSPSLREAFGLGSSRGMPNMPPGASRGPCVETAFRIRASTS
jgi:hypothetical protein